MTLNHILPFVSTAIMAVFTVYVLQRYAVRRAQHFLFWGIGLAMFGAGSFAEAYLALAWNKWVFLIWYLFGAALNAGWLWPWHSHPVDAQEVGPCGDRPACARKPGCQLFDDASDAQPG
jgi:hypothetical protein